MKWARPKSRRLVKTIGGGEVEDPDQVAIHVKFALHVAGEKPPSKVTLRLIKRLEALDRATK